MAVVSARRQPLWDLIETSHPPLSKVNASHNGANGTDDVRSVSGDSASSDEIGNIAKAARTDEPEPRCWDSSLCTSLAVAPEAALQAQGKAWTLHDADALYNVSGWSEGYFKVGDDGMLCVSPAGASGPATAIETIVQSLIAKGLQTPLILRFPDIIGDRIAQLNAAFYSAAQRCAYPGTYRGVFPVKCNHDRDVVQAVLEFGRQYGFGLEVGSKAELLLAMSVIAEAEINNDLFSGKEDGSPPAPMLVCNGYKDAEYMELAARCSQLGVQVVVVMEQPGEVELAVAAALSTPAAAPFLGIRAKLATAHAGHWGTTSGDHAKFGLNAREIVSAVRRLDSVGLLSRLAMLHFHVGSQMSALGAVKDTLAEGANLYTQLIKMGAAGMEYLDVGGGLAIDYDGSASEAHTSKSYSLEGYAAAVVATIGQVCAARGVSAPTIVSESGRALASHHSVVVFDVLAPPETSHSNAGLHGGAKPAQSPSLHSPLERVSLGSSASSPAVQHLHQQANTRGTAMLCVLRQALDSIVPGNPRSVQDALTTAEAVKTESLIAFKEGCVNLEERAAVDEAFDAVRLKAYSVTGGLPGAASIKTLHMNLSVFRSAVDIWAINQVFPIVPLSRLDERPEVHAVLADLTCDSDGKIDAFINPKGGDPLKSLPLHAPQQAKTTSGNSGSGPHTSYHLALFLAGVYQESMGSSHNLFGSLNSATVRLRGGSMASHPSSMSLSSEGAASECSVATELGVGGSREHPQQAFHAQQLHAQPQPLREDACSDDDCIHTSMTWQVGECGSTRSRFVVERMTPGECVAEVLEKAGHNADRILNSMSALAAREAGAGRLEEMQKDAVAECVARRLGGYTYMQQ